MVLIVCLNPAVDKTAVVPAARRRGRLRLSRVVTLAGGKGINAARALRLMGGTPRILGWTAGHSGRWIEDAVLKEGLRADWVRLTRGESRLCLSVADGRGQPLDLNELGPRVGPRDRLRLLARFRAALRSSRLVVLSGSLPPGCPAGFYARLIRAARAAGRPVFLDASQPALAPALAARPDLVKINAEEARALGGTRALLRRGARSAAVTRGAGGAAAVLDGRSLRVTPPRVRALSPIGCGDVFMAGMAAGRLRGWSPERTLAYAAAAATAAAMVPGAGLFRRRDLGRVLGATSVRRG